ncbi:hypothetical protein [Psychrobacter sp. CAL346-MNA-CIBAN-0220]|uniref:hypothetical protein n=1 Tax=Psychrobacter sp. CAL346-MNA-CIBAN-0220 TaxID=3140457 RepID=UPI00331B8879
MKNNNVFFNRISNTAIFLIIVILFFLKLILYILIKNQFVDIGIGGGSDADYYNAYAEGLSQVAVNTWPVMLRYLNDFGLYSRVGISYILLSFSLFVIPLLVNKLAGLDFKKNQKYYLYSFLLCSIYPTIYFYIMDVYRDVFMLFSFLIGCLVVKKSLDSSSFLQFSFLFVLSVLIGWFLIGLRPYLGYAFLLSLLLWKIKFTKKRIIFLGILYFIALFTANYVGAFEFLTEYRAGFDEGNGGSTLGLDFSNPIMFIPNFILSFLGQMLGLYITNPLAIVLLLLETIPFLLTLIYVIKNINLADNFLRFLFIFFIIYGSVWLISNDNLGTAVRLRMYNYLAIYICFFYILRVKSYLRKSKGLLKDEDHTDRNGSE